MADSDLQLVRMLTSYGSYNSGEVRGLPQLAAEDLREKDVCEYVAVSKKDPDTGRVEYKVTRQRKSVEDEENKRRLMKARLESGEPGLYDEKDVAQLFTKISKLESDLDKALRDVAPLKKQVNDLKAELKQARDDNKAASKTISDLSKENARLSKAVEPAEPAEQ